MNIAADKYKVNLNYIKSFDGLRAFAVGIVVFSHWPFPVLTLKFGWLGVNIFFVLSGFLITRILFNTKGNDLRTYLTRFYRNRSLRIFPLYFGYLLAVTVFLGLCYSFSAGNLPLTINEGIIALKNDIGLLLTYTYNFQDLFHLWDGKDDSNHVRFFSHLWSLCVEEQYYLIFPFVVYWLPKRYLISGLILMVFFSPLLRLVTGELLRDRQSEFFTGMIICKLPFYQLDAFAIGGLIALTSLNQLIKPGRWLLIYSVLIGAIGFTEVYFLRKNGIEISWKSIGLESPLYQYQQHTNNLFLNLRYFFTFTLVNIGAGLLIITALHQNFVSKLFQNRFLSYLGKISYGIYLIHFPLLLLLLVALEFFGLDKAMNQNHLLELAVFCLYALITLGLASFSYHFFESYFLRLKR